jgi:hypothetical protein
VIDFMRADVSSGVRTLASSFRIRPPARTTGGWPTLMCRSLAFTWMTVESNFSMATLDTKHPPGGRGADDRAR